MAFKRSGVRFPSPPYRLPLLLDFVIRARVCARDRLMRGWRRESAGLAIKERVFAGIAQLVEHNLAKVGVAGSSPVSRSLQIVCGGSAVAAVRGNRAVSSVGESATLTSWRSQVRVLYRPY